MSVASRRKEKQDSIKHTNAHKRKIQKKSWVRRFLPLFVILGLGAAILLLNIIPSLNNTGNAGGNAAKYPYQVGQPGVGSIAPAIHLTKTDGGTFDLSTYKGKSVLLFFQEGLACQACWDQLKDMENKKSEFQALGIDTFVNITSDPMSALQQKAKDEQYTSLVVADPTLEVSQAYHTTDYGMHPGANGHSFVVVGPDGRIRWRGDYGGAPNYTMYVPIDTLIADIKGGSHGSTN
jgi:Peroxiredoxin